MFQNKVFWTVLELKSKDLIEWWCFSTLHSPYQKQYSHYAEKDAGGRDCCTIEKDENFL